MRITDILFEAAAKEFEYFGSRTLYPNETEILQSLGSVYGKSTVEADFILWAEEKRGSDIDNPVRSYARVAANRLKVVRAETEQAADPRVNEITGFVFGLINRTPHPDDIKRFLIKYTQDEIQDAFKAFAEPLDDYEQKFAIKNFFRDNGGEGVITYRHRVKKAAEQQARDIEYSTNLGLAQSAEELRLRLEEMNEEEKDSSRFGDKPF